ncbi:MAG: VanZ family protein [Gemmatimonadales bacterium]|nr:VanZ family protein [Gemmatimonadales bacterium]
MAELAERIRRWRTPTRLAYVGVLLLATLSPFSFDPDWTNIAARLGRALHPSLAPSDAVDAVRNVVLFAGWGAVWMITGPGTKVWASLRNAVITGAGISLTVESLQLWSALRRASVVDVLTNTAGSGVGALVLLTLVLIIRSKRGGRSFVGIPTITLAGSYVTAAFAEALIPLFRQAAYPNVYGGPFGRFRVSVDLFELGSILPIPIGDILIFLPVGAYGVAAMVEQGLSYRQAGLRVSAAGVFLFALAEVGHGFLGQPIQLGPFVAHALGVTLGAVAAVLWLPELTRQLRGYRRPLGLFLLHSFVICLWAWRPFVPEIDPSIIAYNLFEHWWVPLASLGQRLDLFSVVDVSAGFFLYLPLGALLAVWPLRQQGLLQSFFPGIYLAALTELSQLLIAGRFMDITDFLVQSAGVVIGWVVIRRAGFHPYGHTLRGRHGTAQTAE